MRFPFFGRFAVLTILSAFLAFLPCESYAAAPQDREQMKTLVREIIAENPDLVLDVLKNNSETVLEIAQQGNLQRRRKAMLAQWKEDAKTPKKVDVAGLPFRGSAKAPVTIVAYSDFTCSYCRQAEVIIEELILKHRDAIKVVFKPLPKEDLPVSLAAARYSAAAFMQDEEKGWSFYRILFSEPSALENGGEDFFKSVAARTGLDFKKLQADAAGKKVADQIKKDEEEADRLDIKGTPYFLVNDLVIRGAVPKDIFEEAIKMAASLKK